MQVQCKSNQIPFGSFGRRPNKKWSPGAPSDHHEVKKYLKNYPDTELDSERADIQCLCLQAIVFAIEERPNFNAVTIPGCWNCDTSRSK